MPIGETINVSGFLDTNGDYTISPVDALKVINKINASVNQSVDAAEGEGMIFTKTPRVLEPLLGPKTYANQSQLQIISPEQKPLISNDYRFVENSSQELSWADEVDRAFEDDDDQIEPDNDFWTSILD